MTILSNIYLHSFQSIDLLILTLKELCDSSTDILLSYEERTVGENPKTLQEFLEKMLKFFTCNEIPQQMHDPIYQSDEIHILHYKLKSNHD